MDLMAAGQQRRAEIGDVPTDARKCRLHHLKHL
jgi:hypothetical protein